MPCGCRKAIPPELLARFRWLASDSACTRLKNAVLAGDIAPPGEIESRRAICRACPHRVRAPGPLERAPSDWCGPPMAPTERTSGLLLAAVTVVDSERCPNGCWVRPYQCACGHESAARDGMGAGVSTAETTAAT